MLESLNGSEFVEGRRLPTCERRCLAEARVFAGDWLSHGPERRHTSARLYARQTARNGAVGPDAQHSRGIAHPTGIETHGDDVLFHLRSTASGTVVQQKTPPSTRRVLAQVTLGAAVRCPAFDDLLTVAVGTSDCDTGHEPLLAFGDRQEEAQCAISCSPSPLLEHYLILCLGLYDKSA